MFLSSNKKADSVEEVYQIDSQSTMGKITPVYPRSLSSSPSSTKKIVSAQMAGSECGDDPDAIDHLKMTRARYFQDTSLHGLKYIEEPNRHWTERIFWFIAVLAAVAIAIYFISGVFIKWHKSPVLVSFDSEQKWINEIPFPAVTICNMNMILKSHYENAASKVAADPNDEEHKLELIFAEEVCGNHLEEEDQIEEHGDLSLTGDQFNFFMKDLTPSCENLLKRCTFQGHEVNCTDIFIPIITDEGQCCSFNIMPESIMLKNSEADPVEEKRWAGWSLQDGYVEAVANSFEEEHKLPYKDRSMPMRALGPGQQMGLSVLLDVEEDEYFCSSAESFGFKILPYMPISMPMMKGFGLALHPGTETFLGVRPTIIHTEDDLATIAVDKRQCFFDHEKDLRFFNQHSFLTCYIECMTNQTISMGGCVSFYFPRPSDDPNSPDYVPVCSPDKLECITEAAHRVQEEAMRKTSNCDCLPSCTSIGYPHEATTSSLKKASLLKLSKELLDAKPQYADDEYVKNNLAIVHIFFAEGHLMLHERSRLFTTLDLIAQIGGLLGLCMGLSMISVVELAYFFTMRLYINTKLDRCEEK